jgi:cyclopropane fatty-acyl-phospholipid synthase-like methyltransferase
MNKPFSQSCEENQEVILNSISPYLQPATRVLEIGSGTGQHAVYIGANIPQLYWQCSDLAEYLPGINAWIDEADLPNLARPVELDVCSQWPENKYDVIFSANTFHIMNQAQVEQCMLRCVDCLEPGGCLIIYGPFNYNGSYTSISNENFDSWLKSRDPESGIKHFEWLDKLAQRGNLRLIDDIAMPANNRILIWKCETLSG